MSLRHWTTFADFCIPIYTEIVDAYEEKPSRTCTRGLSCVGGSFCY